MILALDNKGGSFTAQVNKKQENKCFNTYHPGTEPPYYWEGRKWNGRWEGKNEVSKGGTQLRNVNPNPNSGKNWVEEEAANNSPNLVVPERVESGLSPHVAPGRALPVVVPEREPTQNTREPEQQTDLSAGGVI